MYRISKIVQYLFFGDLVWIFKTLYFKIYFFCVLFSSLGTQSMHILGTLSPKLNGYCFESLFFMFHSSILYLTAFLRWTFFSIACMFISAIIFFLVLFCGKTMIHLSNFLTIFYLSFSLVILVWCRRSGGPYFKRLSWCVLKYLFAIFVGTITNVFTLSYALCFILYIIFA